MNSMFVILTTVISLASALLEFDCSLATSAVIAKREFCDDPVFDGVLMATPNSTYFFKGSHVALRLDGNDSIAWGYPKPANTIWPQLPSNIDAVFTYNNTEKTYFLKGSQYWRYSNNSVLDEGYPKPISEGFPGVPNDIEAATQWDKYIYFFKDNMYYKYEPCRNKIFSGPTSDFVGLPSGKIDAVLRYPNNFVYFFKGDVYFKYYLISLKMTPPYPFSSAWDWFTCRWQ